jgi:hypothetical protein
LPLQVRDELSDDGAPPWPAQDDALAMALSFAGRQLGEAGLVVEFDDST